MHRAQADAYRKMPASERLRIAFSLAMLTRETALAGIRGRHPDYSDEKLQMALRRLMLGVETARAVWPGAEFVDP